MEHPRNTNLIVILRLFVLHEKFQTFLPDLWLDMAATAVTLLGLLVLRTIAFILRLIRFANHFCLAMCPNDGHPIFGIANMANFARETGIRLTCIEGFMERTGKTCDRPRILKYADKSVSVCLPTHRQKANTPTNPNPNTKNNTTYKKRHIGGNRQ